MRGGPPSSNRWIGTRSSRGGDHPNFYDGGSLPGRGRFVWGQRQHTLASRLTIVSTLDLGNSWKGRADIARGCRVDEVDEMEVTGSNSGKWVFG